MKKCLIGFIIALISIIPMSNIKAENFNSEAFVQTEFNLYNTVKSNFKNNYPNYDFNDYEYLVFYTYEKDGWYDFYLELYPKILDMSFYYDRSNKGFSINLTNNTSSSLTYDYFTFKISNYNKKIDLTSLEQNSLTKKNKTLPSGKFSDTYMNGAYDWHIVSSTVPFYNYEKTTIIREADDFTPKYLLDINHELKTDVNNNYSYHSIDLVPNDFNENYKYYFKFETDTTKAIWMDMTSDLKNNGYHHENLYYNATLYTMIKDENNNTLETRTFTFTDLISREDYLSPTLDLEVGYSKNDTTKMEEAKIKVKINNYSPRFIYQYSFNDYDYFNIDYKDIVNSKYYITTHVNTSVYVKILSVQGNVIDKKSINVTGLGLDEDVYTYELTFEDLYNIEQEKNMVYSFYYENKKMETRPYIYIFYEGAQDIKFHLSYGSNVTNLANSILNAADNIKDRLSCINLPYTYQDKNLNIDYSYKNYTLFYFTPCTNFKDVENLEIFKDIKVIIKSNINLNIGDSTYIDGVLIPTSRPVTDDFESNYTILFDTFKNAFLRFRNVIFEIIQNISLFFSKISPILQDFYIVIFVLVLFLFLIKFIL